MDAWATLEARRRDRYEAESRRYRPRLSTSPKPPGPRVFSEAIHTAKFLPRFRQPANLTKYLGETNPELWLADYRQECQLGGADDDLADSARAWLEHPPEHMIHGWADLVRIFVENIQGTYMHLGNS
jgi:hypothetical protein